MEGSYVPGQACTTPVPGILTQPEIAADLIPKGLTAPDAAVVAYTGTSEVCKSGDVYASWSDLQAWSPLTAGRYVSAGLTIQQRDHHDPGPAAERDLRLAARLRGVRPRRQRHVRVSQQRLGRRRPGERDRLLLQLGTHLRGRFQGRELNVEATQPSTNIQRSNSVTGGACDTVGAPCSTTTPTQKGKHYQNPSIYEHMAGLLTSGTWLDLQFYKLVTGSSSLNSEYSWDCTSSDPTLHWTSEPELYCQDDFDAILASLPAGTVSADPATVAAAWGRTIP